MTKLDRYAEHERASRLWQMCYLRTELLPAELANAYAEWERANVEWNLAFNEWFIARSNPPGFLTPRQADDKWDRACGEYHRVQTKFDRTCAEQTPAVEALIRELVPDMTWNGKEFVFPTHPHNIEKEQQ